MPTNAMQYKKAVKSTIIISLTTGLASVFGFALQSLIAATFGAGSSVDAYVAAQTIPDIFTKILQGGILSIVFVPIFVKLICKKELAKAWKIAGNLINILALLFGIFVVVGIAITPWLVDLIVPGFSPETKELTTQLTRIFFPTVLLNVLTVLVVSTLHAFRKFNLPASLRLILPSILTPLLLVFKDSLGVGIIAYGTLLATTLQTIVVFVAIYRLGFRFSFKFNLKDPTLKKLLILTYPFVFATLFSQTSTIIDKILASNLDEGSISALFFSNKIFRFVSGFFLTALPIVSFPSFAEFIANKNYKKLFDSMRTVIRMIVFITLPATAGLIILSLPVTQLLFQRGNFTLSNSQLTAAALVFYALGLLFNGLNHIWGNIFYALEKTKILVKISILVVSANIILNLLLVGPLAHRGIALATTLSYFISFVLHFCILQKSLKRIKALILDYYYLRIILSTVLMSVVTFLLWPQIQNLLIGSDIILQSVRLFAIILVSLITYLAFSLLLQVKEANIIFAIVKHYLNAIKSKLERINR